MLCAWRKLGSVSGDSRIHSFASLPRLLAYTNTGFKAYDYAELAALTFQIFGFTVALQGFSVGNTSWRAYVEIYLGLRFRSLCKRP